MGGKNRAPAPPDYRPLMKAQMHAAELASEIGREQNQISREQLEWAREAYAYDMEVMAPIIESAIQRQQLNDKAAIADRKRYEEIFQPLEDQMAADAESYSSPERQRMDMEQAQSTVAQNFESQRRAAIQNLESFGVDPSSTRHAALDAGSRVAQAAAQAGAGNQARAQSEAIGRALRSEAINVGRGYPGQVAGTYATALQSGNQGANTQLAGTASGASAMGTGTQWGGTANQAFGNQMAGLQGASNTMNQGYQNQLAAANFNSQQSSGLGGLAGSLLGAAGNAGGFAALFAEGGAVPEGIPSGIPSEVTRGGNVPPQASPTGGAAIDDVDAKLTAGEFVVPKDVVSWKGEEFFQRLIDGSRKAKPQASAQPEYAIAPPADPTFASRPQPMPQQSALPVGA